MIPRPLPAGARDLCEQLSAPARLVAHLALVHDAAADFLGRIDGRFPGLVLDREAVLFGAATHDLGKTLHPGELTGPGRRHEEDGPGLLESRGIPSALARFARTHASWREDAEIEIEDLLVALADAIWKGRRDEELEDRLAGRLSGLSGVGRWEAFSALDEIVEAIVDGADARLAWQSTFPA